MPVLHISQPQQHIQQLYLPSTANLPQDEQAWVKLDVGPESVADWQVITDGDQNYAVRQSRIIVNRIKEWNFVDEQGQPVPITFESFWALPAADRLYLLTVKFDQSANPALSAQEKKT